MAQDNSWSAKTKTVLTYEVTKDDHVAFNVLAYKRFETLEDKSWIILWVIIMAFALLSVFTSQTVGYREDAATYNIALIVVSAIFVTLAVVILKLLMPLIMKCSFKLMIKKNTVEEFVGECKLEILDDKIRGTINGMLVELPYGRIKSIESDKERLYIFIGVSSAVIVPFSAFKNDAGEKQEFIDTIHSKISGEKVSQAELKKNEKDKKTTKKIEIVCIIAALVAIPFALYLLYASVPLDGIWYMQEFTFADPSYLDGAEQISVKKKESTTEYDMHVELNIQKEQAQRMIENNVLKECVDSSIKFGDYGYLCSDPIWEAPNSASMMYPTDNQDALCTRSWLDLPPVNDLQDYESTLKNISILCVNSETGELWYSYYSESSTGWE